jgi:stage III sporulation protein AF
MSFLIEWVTNIILFILLATVIDMLLPNSNMQKYTKIVTGLLLIAIILSPVLKLLSHDFEANLNSIPAFQKSGDENMKNLIEMKKKEIQASNDAYILETMAVQLEKDAEEELMNQYGLVISNIDIQIDEGNQKTFPDNLQRVSVLLEQPGKETETIEAVKQVEINTGKPLSSKKTTEQSKLVVSLLSEKWNVSEKTIEVTIEGGGNRKDG